MILAWGIRFANLLFHNIAKMSCMYSIQQKFKGVHGSVGENKALSTYGPFFTERVQYAFVLIVHTAAIAIDR